MPGDNLEWPLGFCGIHYRVVLDCHFNHTTLGDKSAHPTLPLPLSLSLALLLLSFFFAPAASRRAASSAGQTHPEGGPEMQEAAPGVYVSQRQRQGPAQRQVQLQPTPRPRPRPRPLTSTQLNSTQLNLACRAKKKS